MRVIQLIEGLQSLNRRRPVSDRGAALVEYGLLVALLALAAIGAVVIFGGGVADLFTSTELDNI